jgi:hypothetical protein
MIESGLGSIAGVAQHLNVAEHTMLLEIEESSISGVHFVVPVSNRRDAIKRQVFLSLAPGAHST